MSFTPGPWEPYSDWYIRAQIGMGALATVVKPMRPDVSDDECRANARLIAAAPELLELLDDIIGSGVAFDDPRLRWMEVQIDRDTIMAARKLIERIKAVQS